MGHKHFQRVCSCFMGLIIASTLAACGEPAGTRAVNSQAAGRSISGAEINQAEDALVERTAELLIASQSCADVAFVEKEQRRFDIFSDQIDNAESNRDKMAAINRVDSYLDDYEQNLEKACTSSSDEAADKSSGTINVRPRTTSHGSRNPPTRGNNPTDAEVRKAVDKALDRDFELLIDPFDFSTCQKPELKEKYRQLSNQSTASLDDFTSSNLAKMRAVEDLNAVLDSYEAELAQACDPRSDDNIGNPTDEDVYVNAMFVAKRGARIIHGIGNCPPRELFAKYQRLFSQYGPVLEGKLDNRERIRSLIDYYRMLEDYEEESVAACGGQSSLFGFDPTPAKPPGSGLSLEEGSPLELGLSDAFFDNLLCGTAEAIEQQKQLFRRSIPVVGDGVPPGVYLIQPIDDPKLDAYDENLLSACYR